MIVALDLETTWLDKLEDSIIEVALVKFDEQTGQIIDKYSTLVNPWFSIPDFITSITWISDEDVKNAPFFDDVLNKISEFIWDNPILWHNTQFDKWFLVYNGVDLKNNIELDTFFLANIFLRNEKTLSLESIYNYYFWDSSDKKFHRALDDAIATKDIFMELIKEFLKISENQKDIISYIFSKSRQKDVEFYFNYFDKRNKNEIDIIEIVKNTIDYHKTSEMPENKDISFNEWNFFNVDNFSNIDNFEIRENQKIMWEKVWEALFWNTKEIIEAPTGVWKTFAYLIPSILYSLKNWEQIIISTKTKALQDQICYKDLQDIKNTWFNFNFVKLKWKQNYVSIYRFLNFLFDNSNLISVDVSTLSKIFFWLLESKTWELDELNFYPFEFYILNNVNSDNFITLDQDNPFKKREFLFKARKSVEDSNIIVVNHSLLFQDVKSGSWLLWWIDNIIFDEAHSIEDVATESLKINYTLTFVEETFSRIEEVFNKNKSTFAQFWKLKEEILFDLKSIFDLFFTYLSSEIPGIHWQSYSTILLSNTFYDKYLNEFNLHKPRSEAKITDFINLVSDIDDKIYMSILPEIENLEWLMKLFSIFSDNKSHDEYIKTISYNKKTWINLSYTYLNPWMFLKEKLWDKLDSCIFTSATLTVWEDFKYIKNLLDLEDFNETKLESDFDYSKQSLLFLPNNLWNIKNNSPLVNSFLEDLLKNVKWNTMILCTSFSAIKEIYVHLSSTLKDSWINIYAQSFSGWKNKIIESFKKDADNSVIIWTDTFWEWIDLPWDLLKYLVIHKLPFPVPTDPVFKARSSLFKDPFREYSVSKSIIKLKQGFWRLIRTKNDKWVVILLDNRVINTNWWNMLYSAFPSDIVKKIWTTESFINALSKWK